MMEAARVALDCDDHVEQFSDAYRHRRNLMVEGLEDIPGLRIVNPEGAFYLFIDVTGTGMSDVQFADGALKAGVQLIPASLITGGEGFHSCILCCLRGGHQRRNKQIEVMAL